MKPDTLRSDRKDYNWMLELLCFWNDDAKSIIIGCLSYFVYGRIILVLFFNVAIWFREG